MKIKRLNLLSAVNKEVDVHEATRALHLIDIRLTTIDASLGSLTAGDKSSLQYIAHHLILIPTIYDNIMGSNMSREKIIMIVLHLRKAGIEIVRGLSRNDNARLRHWIKIFHSLSPQLRKIIARFYVYTG